jgi:ABC-type nitrate/sulfonate/bicarbonate transport system substrate-binding protein/signal transduction histidine kinase
MKLLKIFFILLLITLSSNAQNNSLEHVSLQLQWKHQFEFAGFYAAKEKGFYKDVGLDVEFIEYDKSINITDEVIKGKAEYGLSYSSIIAEYIEGKPIVLLANFFKQSPLVLVTQKEIKTLADIKGKKVMGVSNSIDNITLLLMLNKFDIEFDDVINMPTTFNVDDFANKKIDAMSVFTTNELYALDKKGIEYNVFDPVVYGAKYYDVNLFTSKKEALKNPKRVQNFKNASIKGWEYALKHKEEIVDLILNKYNTQNKLRDELLFESKQIEQIMLPNVHAVGSVDVNRLQLIADNFIQSGFIKKQKQQNIKEFFFNNIYNFLELSEEEIKYLKNKEKIKMCIDPNWMPFEAIINGKHVGLSADFISLLKTNFQLPIELIHTDTWSESIENIKQKKCDLLSLAMQTEDRKKYLNFTSPYIETPLVIVSKKDKYTVVDMSFIENEKIAVVKDYAINEILKSKYPNLKIVEVKNIQQGLKKVHNNEVYGFADTLASINYYLQMTNDEKLGVNVYFNEKLSLSFGIRNDDIHLQSILEKVIDNIEENQKKQMLKRWLTNKPKDDFDYDLFLKILAFIFVVFILIVVRNYNIKKLNMSLKKRVEEELEKSRDKDKILYHQNKLASMGEMLENIAHQWRQPLSQINSSVLLIDNVLEENNFKNKEVEERLLEIESLTKYLSNTIDDFKDFFDKDKSKKTFFIKEMIQRSVHIVKGSLDKYSISITVDIDASIEYSSYENELQQVIVVILNNSKDALLNRNTYKPEINIILKKEDNFYLIKICDNAGGITRSIREKIFEPYYTTKHKSQGTGLGLYMSKKIVEESLKGELHVKNSEYGACFTIKLRGNDE